MADLITLTHEQAELFRLLRPRLWKVMNELAALTSEFHRACPHADENDPDCPVCWVYESCRGAEVALHDAPGHIDAALIRGPHPHTR